MGKQFFCRTCKKIFFLVLWASGVFFELSAPAVTVIYHGISSHENESAEIFGKNLLGYVFCCD